MNNKSIDTNMSRPVANDLPMVSVIIAVYNVEAYLKQCLDSVIGQTLNNIEIICVDDGSTDSSLQILEEYQLKDSRIKIIRQEHAGAGAARNKGLQEAKGEYLSILDSDDFFEPDMLKKAYYTAKVEDADIVVFRSDFYDEQQHIFVPCDYSIREDVLPDINPFGAMDIPDRIFNIGCGWAWDKLFRRDFVEENNARFQEIRTSNDMFFVFYLYSKAESIYVMNTLFAHRRINAYNTLSVTRELSWDNFYLALMALKEQLIADGTYDTFRHSFVNWSLNFSLWNIDTLDKELSREVKQKCREEYFEKLDILHNDPSYFLYDYEYKRLERIMGQVVVSVVIPVYNGEKYIRQCLDSVCGQTLQEIQIICVNDGSTDSTADILKEYESRDDRIIVVDKEHTNAGESRNLGMKLAEGEYISFLDADDFFEPDMLEAAYTAIKETDSQICAFRCDQFDEQTKQFRECPWTLKLEVMPEHRPFSSHDCADVIFTMTSCTSWDKLYKRSFVVENKIEFQSIPVCNDMAFTFSALSTAERITTVDKIFVHHRIGHEKSMSKAFELCTSCYYDALYCLKQFLVEKGTYPSFKQSFVNWALDFSLFTMHSFTGSFKRLVRQQLKHRNFRTLDILDMPESAFYNKDQYFEMVEIMSEPQEIDNTSAPLVSVIMPMFNLEPYLRRSMDTVVFQTLENIEIICVDDGSTDHTADILEDYRSFDQRIKIVRQENAGAGAARNTGIDMANGEYMIFLDGDDVFDAELLEKTVARAIETDADIVAFNFTQTDAQNRYSHRVGIHTEFLDSDKETFNYTDCPDRIMTVVNPTPWNKLYRSDFVKKHGLKFEEISSSNDITFAAVSVAKAERISYLKDELLHYNRGLSGSITDGKQKKLLNVITAVNSAVEQAQKLSYEDEIENSILYFVVDNFAFALEHNIVDIHDEVAKKFYDLAHEYLNREMFDDVSEENLNSQLYPKYRVLKEVEYETLVKAYDTEKIISLTSYPARIDGVAQVVDSLLNQKLSADRIVLCLAECEFPGKETDLPADIIQLVNDEKLELLWCDENLGPHKKYYYTMQRFPDAIVITADDDLLYPETTIGELFIGYLLYPEAVSAVRTHLISVDENGKILSYNEWIMEYDGIKLQESMQLISTGVSGVLYPPGIFNEKLFDRETIKKTCFYGDDLWLKINECICGIPTVCVSNFKNLKYIQGSQETALCKSNVDRNRNDIQWKKIANWADSEFGRNIISNCIMNDPMFVSQTQILYIKNIKMEKQNKALMQRLKDAEQQIKKIKAQQSDMKIITSLSKIGLHKGASIESVYDMTPNKHILIVESGELSQSSLPANQGILQIVKLLPNRAYINFFSKGEGKDARMFIQSNGQPTGKWVLEKYL